MPWSREGEGRHKWPVCGEEKITLFRQPVEAINDTVIYVVYGVYMLIQNN